MEKKEIELQKEYREKVYKINEGKNKKYFILTMGCQLNENDSEKIAGMLETMGYAKAEQFYIADIIIFNTCCVRENAEERLFGKLGEVKKQREKKGTIIAIGGCMMQQDHMIERIKTSYPFVDILFGTHTLHKLPQDIYETLHKQSQVEDILDIDGEVIEGLPIKRNHDKKASVTIMYGCNNFCAYCIVPYVRGRERSRLPQDILNEIKELAKSGYKEVTLLGQNVNSYQGDNKLQNFAQLLEAVEQIDGIETIRFVSPHPKDFTQDVIKVISKSKKISKIIHLPLQSGSSKVLKEMNRKYTKEQYLDLVKKMKEEIPEVTFSTDIIVGFPGETEQDFEDTLDVVREVNFEQVYMFIYSKRVGTPAASKENQIAEEIKHKRFNRLKDLVDNQIEKNNLKYVGKRERLLIEGVSKNNENMLTGRAENNKVIILEGSKDLIGKVIDVEIISEHKWYLKAKKIDL